MIDCVSKCFNGLAGAFCSPGANSQLCLPLGVQQLPCVWLDDDDDDDDTGRRRTLERALRKMKAQAKH